VRWFWLFAASAVSAFAPLAQGADRAPVVRVVAADSVLSGKLAKLQGYARAAGVTLETAYVQDLPTDDDTWLLGADLLVIDAPLRNARLAALERVSSVTRQPKVRWIDGGPDSSAHGGLPEVHATRLIAYYNNGGPLNYRRFFEYVQKLHAGLDVESVPTPVVIPRAGFYHPDAPALFATLEDYLAWGRGRWKPGAVRAAFAMHATAVSNMQTRVVDAVVRQSERNGLLPLAFWFDSENPRALHDALHVARPDVLVNMHHMGNAPARTAEIRELDVPVLQTLNHRDSGIEAWRTAPTGSPARMLAPFITVYETWGLQDPLVVSALEDGEPTPIPEQVEALVGKASALGKLRHARPEDKRLALMFWNYPIGEKNLSASNLNVPRSLERFTESLAAAGYDVSPTSEAAIIEAAQQLLRPLYRHDALDELLTKGLGATVPLARYRAWLESLPAANKKALLDRWGDPGAHWALRTIDGEQQFVVPRLQLGKLVVLPQLPRSDEPGGNYHDPAVPPSHYYLAAYLYIREVHRADALIHFGTHGTQEWLPGKDRGLSAYDAPFLAVGDVPVVYPYIQDNIGEALQAKRRGRAVVVSHQTPPFAPSALYDELADLHSLMHEYVQLDDGAVKDRTARRIRDKTVSAAMDKDLGWTVAQIDKRFDDFLDALHHHLHELSRRSIPLGLHTFGEPSSPDNRLKTVMQQLGEPFYAAAQRFAAANGESAQSHHAHHDHSHHHDEGGPGSEQPQPFAVEQRSLQESMPYQVLSQHLRGSASIDEVKDEELRELLTRARQLDLHLANPGETEALLHALSGRFVLPGAGGDPIRNPDVPSGRNLFGFEPDKLPTKAAFDSGAEALTALTDGYRSEHGGRAPEKLAFSLWSVEAMRHLGVVESQVLHALGLRPVWDRGGRVTALEIVPAAELGRPRIDAVVQVTGAYRDQFEPFMRLLADAIDRLAQLKEPENIVAVNSHKASMRLQQQGVSAERAEALSRVRLFGNKPGDYGVGLADATLDSAAWTSEAPLATQYLSRLQHAYGASDVTWGVAEAERTPGVNVYAEHLRGVQAAVLGRSSNTYGVLSGDDPFQYLGGLSLAVRHLDGTSPALYITDLRRPKDLRMTTAAQFLSDELRTRYQNPQWISAMQREGYAGTQELLKGVNNLWGWQVMDRTTVRADQWQSIHDTYVKDARRLGINEWFERHNPTAQAQMIERLAEAIRKGYWDASPRTRRELAARWDELVKSHGVDTGHAVTKAFLQQLGDGFDLPAHGAKAPSVDTVAEAVPESSRGASPAVEAPPEPVQQPPVVQGQVLEPVDMKQPPSPPVSVQAWLSLLLLLGCALLGGALQLQRPSPRRTTSA
jgi:cobaltochelatase CobN